LEKFSGTSKGNGDRFCIHKTIRVKTENEYWKKLRSEFKIGDSISTYLVYQCGLIALGNSTKIKGKVIEINDRKLKIKILEFVERKKMKRILKCNDIKNNEFLQNVELVYKNE